MCPLLGFRQTGARVASTFDLADKALGGQLEESLSAWRADGLTIDRIAQRLQGDGIDVSRETVRRWLQKLGIEEAA